VEPSLEPVHIKRLNQEREKILADSQVVEIYSFAIPATYLLIYQPFYLVLFL
jgi:hypothetical protein